MIVSTNKLVATSPVPVAYDPTRTIKRLGLIALATDRTAARNFARLFPADRPGIRTRRVACENPATPENLCLMEPNPADAADLVLPARNSMRFAGAALLLPPSSAIPKSSVPSIRRDRAFPWSHRRPAQRWRSEHSERGGLRSLPLTWSKPADPWPSTSKRQASTFRG